jgi:hypothetical protein
MYEQDDFTRLAWEIFQSLPESRDPKFRLLKPIAHGRIWAYDATKHRVLKAYRPMLEIP